MFHNTTCPAFKVAFRSRWLFLCVLCRRNRCSQSNTTPPPLPLAPSCHSLRLLGEQLFYILGACYTLLFLFISLILRSAPLGLANWGSRPERVVGWLSFVAIESYGSLAVALFWAFTNATVDLDAAKASYGLVIAGAQIGAIIGTTAVLRLSTMRGSALDMRLFLV